MDEKLTTDKKIATSTTDTTDISSKPFNGLSTGNLTAAEILTKLDSENQNILDSYENVTYHFKLIYPYNGNDIVIAESAKTNIYITSCEIESYIGQDFKVRNVSATTMTLKLKESQGTTLFDKLIFLQNTYGGDYKTCEYKISLTFYGYDSNGNGKTNIGGTYLWSVIMTSIDFKFDVFGTEYTMQFVAKSNLAFSDEIGVINNGGGFQTSGKLGDILSSMKNYLNEENRKNNGNVQLINYDFKDEPYSILGVPLNVSITSPFDMIVTNNSLMNADDSTSFNDSDVQYSKGLQISKFIEGLMANSPDAVGLSINMPNPSLGSLVAQNDSTYSITHKIIASVTYNEFDNVLNQYRRDVTYTIVPRISVAPIMSSEQVNTQNNYFDNWSVEKFKNIYQYNMLNKKYNYVFTGKNTNVFDFNISGNMHYALNFPTMLGVRQSSTSLTEGQVASNTIQAAISYGDAGQSIKDDAINKQKAYMAFNDAKRNMGIAADQNIDFGKSTETSIDDLMGNTRGGEMQNALTNEIYNNSTTDDYNASQANLAALEDTKRKSLTQKLSSSGRNYVDDMFTMSSTDQLYIPVNFTGQQNAFSYNGFVSDNSDNTASIFSTIMNQVYSSGTDCLQNISMKIRLDPYWIGCSEDQVKDNSTVDLSNDENKNEYDYKDTCLVLDFNVPVTTSDSSQVTLNRNNMISGAYIIYKVTSVFGDGEMHQILDGSKLIQTHMSSIIKLSGGQ